MRDRLLMQKSLEWFERETGEWREGGRHLNCFEGMLNDLSCVVSYALGLEKC